MESMEPLPTQKVFKTQVKLKFREADSAGVMFFGNLLGITHDVFETFLEENAISWDEWFMGKNWACPIRHSEVDFISPLFPGQTYFIEAKLSKLSTTSFNMHYEYRNSSDKLCARVQMTHTFVDKNTLQKIEIPEKYKSLLLPYCLERF